jgi:hypothetical protein
MANKLKSILSYFFKDKHGKVVIIQWPNIPLWTWIFSKLLGQLLPSGVLASGIEKLGSAAIFVWAYLEATAGESKFRRTIGVIVLLFMIKSFFAL